MRAIWILLAMASVAVARHHHKTYVMEPAESETTEINRNPRQISSEVAATTNSTTPVATCGCGRARRAIESTEGIEDCRRCKHRRHKRSVSPAAHHVYKTEYIVEEEHVRKQEPNVYTSHVYKRRISGEMTSQEVVPLVKDDMRQVRDTVGYVFDDGKNKPIAQVNVRTERFERKLQEEDVEDDTEAESEVK